MFALHAGGEPASPALASGRIARLFLYPSSVHRNALPDASHRVEGAQPKAVGGVGKGVERSQRQLRTAGQVGGVGGWSVPHLNLSHSVNCTRILILTFSPSRLHIITLTPIFAFTPSHLRISTFTPSHLYTLTPSHIHSYLDIHIHAFSPSHIHTLTFTRSHTHISTLHSQPVP